MKQHSKHIAVIARLTVAFVAALVIVTALTGCTQAESSSDVAKQQSVQDTLSRNQATPTDIDYSLERYNLIKRAYWVNGQREKALALPCAVEKPLGYIVLLSDNGAVFGRYVVDGKVTSLNSFLSPDSEHYEITGEYYYENDWLADVDGSFGENDSGIFFFTPDGNYYEWTGTYLYTDVPVEVDDPVIHVEGSADE